MNILGNHEPYGTVREKNYFTFRQCVWCSQCQNISTFVSTESTLCAENM